MTGGIVASLLLLLASIYPPVLVAKEAAADVSSMSLPLGSWSRVYRDADATLTVDDLLTHPEQHENFAGEKIVSFFFTNDAYWLVVPLHNPQQQSLQRLLVFEPVWLDDIRITLVGDDGRRQAFHGGDFVPFSQRAIEHRKINFQLAIPPGNSKLFVRVKTVDPFVVNMELLDLHAFHTADIAEAAYLGVVYGVLGAMLLYNLVLFVSIRESVYAAYVAYVLFFLLWYTTNNGFTFQHLLPDSPVMANWVQSVGVYSIMFTGLYFTINFLQLSQRMPRIYFWAGGLFVCFLLSFILTALGGYQPHVISAILWVMIYTPALIVFGLLALLMGNRAARYFVPATTAGFLGSGITALAVSGLIPFNDYTYRAVDIGMLIDAILLSIALADRLKLARAETEEARTALYQATESHARELEEEVAQRTRELREANITKDRFFSIIAHDLRGPISGLSLLFNDVVKSAADFTETQRKIVCSTTKTTHLLLDQLLTWARSQRDEIEQDEQPLELNRLLTEVQALYQTQAEAKDVQLQYTPSQQPCWVRADNAMLQTVVRNLLHNALKFTDSGGVVESRVFVQDGVCRLEISDSGIGMSEEKSQSLFRLDTKPGSIPGTHGEQGSGLGLILCREFIQRNCGEIGVQSKPGEGSTFWFSLPRIEIANVFDASDVTQIRPLSILVAEDLLLNRETSGRMLQELGHQVTFVEDGFAVAEKALGAQYDLILMDIDIPGIDGIEATRRIRASISKPPRIVAWSSYSRHEIEAMAEGTLFDGYLDKPLSQQDLNLNLSRMFSHE